MTALYYLIRYAEAYTNVEERTDGVRGDTRGLTPSACGKPSGYATVSAPQARSPLTCS